MRIRRVLGYSILIIGIEILEACIIASDAAWEKVSSTFMKDSKPYGPGDFRVQGNQFITLKIADPETPTKPISKEQLANPQSVSEFTEPWMYDVRERANRRSARLIHGQINGLIQELFKENAQNAAWWLAQDWKTVYISTGWMDYHDDPKPGERYTPQTSKLFKSLDHG